MDKEHSDCIRIVHPFESYYPKKLTGNSNNLNNSKHQFKLILNCNNLPNIPVPYGYIGNGIYCYYEYHMANYDLDCPLSELFDDPYFFN